MQAQLSSQPLRPRQSNAAGISQGRKRASPELPSSDNRPLPNAAYLSPRADSDRGQRLRIGVQQVVRQTISAATRRPQSLERVLDPWSPSPLPKGALRAPSHVPEGRWVITLVTRRLRPFRQTPSKSRPSRRSPSPVRSGQASGRRSEPRRRMVGIPQLTPGTSQVASWHSRPLADGIAIESTAEWRRLMSFTAGTY